MIALQSKFYIHSTLSLLDILRKYDDSTQEILELLPLAYTNISTDEARTSLVWILGEFGNDLPDACNIMDAFAD